MKKLLIINPIQKIFQISKFLAIKYIVYMYRYSTIFLSKNKR